MFLVSSIIALLKVKAAWPKKFFFVACAWVVLAFATTYISASPNIFDFLLIYKAFIYVVLLTFFIRRNFFSDTEVSRLFYLLLAAYFVKYSIATIISDSSIRYRPGIFTENNFELILLLVLYIRTISFQNFKGNPFGRREYVQSLVIFLVLLLSGSRSATVAGLAGAAILFTRLDSYKSLLRAFLLILIASGVAGFVFFTRLTDSDFQDIDRVRMFWIFYDVQSGKGFLEWLVGSPPITALPVWACNELSYYQSLFSYSGDGSCYSVIFHSYLFRAIHDYGFAGLGFIMFFVWYGLKLSCKSLRELLAIFSIIFLNGLSVSSMNSIFSAIALAIVFSSYIRIAGTK